jgi:hypothetical protein
MYTNCLDNRHPLAITRLRRLRLTSLVRASHDLRGSDDSHLEAGLVEVVDVVLVNPVLSYCCLQALKPGLEQC